jgi:hypothetical protein
MVRRDMRRVLDSDRVCLGRWGNWWNGWSGLQYTSPKCPTAPLYTVYTYHFHRVFSGPGVHGAHLRVQFGVSKDSKLVVDAFSVGWAEATTSKPLLVRGSVGSLNYDGSCLGILEVG